MRTLLLVLASACSETVWLDMGDFSASYTAPDATVQMIPSGPVELP